MGPTMRLPPPVASAVLAVALGAVACGGTLKVTRFSNPRFNFGFVQRVAVLPFENYTNDRQAGLRATRLAITELLATGAVEVVEPGEVLAALTKMANLQPGRAMSPSKEQILSLGQALEVQALVLGAVTQSENLRSGAVPIPVVSLDLRMVETETGATVWAATNTEKGSSVSARVLGTGGEPIAETTRECIRKLLATLVE